MAENGRFMRVDDALPVRGRRIYAESGNGFDIEQSPILPEIDIRYLTQSIHPSELADKSPRKLKGADYQAKDRIDLHLGVGLINKLPENGTYAVIDVLHLDAYPMRLTVDARFGGISLEGNEIVDLIDLHELSTALVYGHEKTMIDGQVAHCLIIPRVDNHYIILTFTNKTSQTGEDVPAATYMAEELSILRQRMPILSPDREEILRIRAEKSMKRKKKKENLPVPEDMLDLEIAHFTQVLTEAGIPPDRDQWQVTKRHIPEVNYIQKSVKDMTEKEVRAELKQQIDRAKILPENEALQQAVSEYLATKLQVPWTTKPDDKWWTVANLGSFVSCTTSLAITPITVEAWSIGLAFIEVIGAGFAGLYLVAQLADYLTRRKDQLADINRLALRKIRLAQDPVDLKQAVLDLADGDRSFDEGDKRSGQKELGNGAIGG